MGKGGGSAPPPPDYRAAARETAAGDLEAARANAAANRVNQFTPYGSLVYSQQGKFDPRGYEQAYQSYQKARSQQGAALPEGYSLTDPNPMQPRLAVMPKTGFQFAYGPNGEQIEVPLGSDQLKAPRVEDFLTAPANLDEGWTATQFLSPEQQKLLDYQNATSMGLGELTGKGLGYVESMLDNPFSTSTLPTLQSSVGDADLQRFTGNANLGLVGQGPQLQTSLQDQGMAGWDRASDLMMQRLRPQMDIQNENLDVKLANQGITAGTEAYNRAKQSLGMQQNDLMTQAQLQAQGIGQNLFTQALQGGQFGNTATQQGYQNLLAQQQANNPALQQMYQNQQAQQQANNAIAQQMFGNRLTNANLGNTARQQGFNELAYMRNEPLNTLNAVRTGSQVTNPSFTSVPQQAVTRGADMLGAATAQGNYDTAAANAAQAGQSGMTSGLMSLAGTGMMAF
jgi:hypothetical protein